MNFAISYDAGILTTGRNSVDKRTVIENYDLVSLAIDEIVDDGIILETDPVIVATRVSKPPSQDVNVRGIELSETGILQLVDGIRKGGFEGLRRVM